MHDGGKNNTDEEGCDYSDSLCCCFHSRNIPRVPGTFLGTEECDLHFGEFGTKLRNTIKYTRLFDSILQSSFKNSLRLTIPEPRKRFYG